MNHVVHIKSETIYNNASYPHTHPPTSSSLAGGTLFGKWHTTPPYERSSHKGLIFAKRAILLLRYKPFLFFYSYIVQYLQVFKYVLFGRADYDWFLTPNSSLMVNKSCIHTQIFSLFINDEIMYSHANLFIIHQ